MLIYFYGERLFILQWLQDQSFSIFAATIHIWRLPSPTATWWRSLYQLLMSFVIPDCVYG